MMSGGQGKNCLIKRHPSPPPPPPMLVKRNDRVLQQMFKSYRLKGTRTDLKDSVNFCEGAMEKNEKNRKLEEV